MMPYDYPAQAHKRKHGPGYSDYESFRDWLRDEFSFRCVYCLTRESFTLVKACFDLDHFVAVKIDETMETNYDNLLYSCHSCNAAKGKRSLPDPSVYLTAPNVTVASDGTIEGVTKEAKRIIRVLGLDSPDYVRFRKMFIVIAQSLACMEAFEYPADLPDLGSKRPEYNIRPNGITTSAFALRAAGKLPRYY